jgi:hypothetical protein
MATVTIPQKEYKNLVKRQSRIEEELAVLREVVKEQAGDELIRPAILKKWERISGDLDRGQGRVFKSQKEIKAWFKNLYYGSVGA